MLIGTFEISKCITIKCCPSSLIALYKRNRLGYTNILFIHKRRKDLILSGHYKIICTLCCTYLIGATQPAECSSAGLTQTERKISQFPFPSRYPPLVSISIGTNHFTTSLYLLSFVVVVVCFFEWIKPHGMENEHSTI
jgi:acyl-CoA synthetase (AMP-forming)/AMP-acid ligase II